MKKGTLIEVVGQLKEREHDGKKYQTCNVMQVELLGSKQEQQAAQTAPAQGGAEEQTDELPF